MTALVLRFLPLFGFLGIAGPGRCSGAEHQIPPPYGPYTNLTTEDFAHAKSFGGQEKLLGTYYFYWYCVDTREHIVNSEDGSDGLTDHPPTLKGFCYRSVPWHKKQLADMAEAGIDFALMVFWGAPSEQNEKASLHWSYAGLKPLVQARATNSCAKAKSRLASVYFMTPARSSTTNGTSTST